MALKLRTTRWVVAPAAETGKSKTLVDWLVFSFELGSEKKQQIEKSRDGELGRQGLYGKCNVTCAPLERLTGDTTAPGLSLGKA